MKKQPTFSKKAISPAILTGVIAIVSTLVVILIFVTPRLVELITGSGEQAGCQLSMLVSTTAEKATWGFGKEVPVECKTKRKTVTIDDVERLRPIAKQALDGYKLKDSPAYYMFNQGNELGQTKWALAKIVADEMTGCYDRGWRGNLDMKKTGVNAVLKGLDGNYVCILCSRIDFDQKIKSLNIENMEVPFFAAEQAFRGKTYFDYLTEAKDERSANEVKIGLTMSRTPATEPLAVMFLVDEEGYGRTHVNPYGSITTDLGLMKRKAEVLNPWNAGLQSIGIDVSGNWRYVTPLGIGLGQAIMDLYRKITSDKSNVAKCAVIIGD